MYGQTTEELDIHDFNIHDTRTEIRQVAAEYGTLIIPVQCELNIFGRSPILTINGEADKITASDTDDRRIPLATGFTEIGIEPENCAQKRRLGLRYCHNSHLLSNHLLRTVRRRRLY